MELAKNQEHTVTIEGYGEGGMGVARIDGRVVFVHGALRGEKCRVLILKTLKSVALCQSARGARAVERAHGIGLPVFSALRRLHVPPHPL